MMVIDLLKCIIVLCFWVGFISMLLFVLIFFVVVIIGVYLVGVDWLGVDLGSFWLIM